MRDNLWLKERLDVIWDTYFKDVPRLNKIQIHFGRKARRRLASIRQTNRYNKKSDTEIVVTGFYRSKDVPGKVVDVTIAHELCHYAHGFASPLPQYSKFPHRGDLVDSELIKRGLGSDLKYQEKWLKTHWNGIVKEKIFTKKRTKKPSTRSFSFFDLFLSLGRD